MKIEEYKVKVFGKQCIVELMSFNKQDKKKWKQVFDT